MHYPVLLTKSVLHFPKKELESFFYTVCRVFGIVYEGMEFLFNTDTYTW